LMLAESLHPQTSNRYDKFKESSTSPNNSSESLSCFAMLASSSRLFVALTPTPPIQSALSELGASIPQAQAIPPEKLHLTLRYLGPQPVDAEARCAEALERVQVKPFFLELEACGAFPETGPPHVIWMGVGRGHPLLFQLRQQVDDVLLSTGLTFDLKPFSPHVTLARCVDRPPDPVRHWLKKHHNELGPLWPVSQFTLYASEPSPTGRIYRKVRDYPLQ